MDSIASSSGMDSKTSNLAPHSSIVSSPFLHLNRFTTLDTAISSWLEDLADNVQVTTFTITTNVWLLVLLDHSSMDRPVSNVILDSPGMAANALIDAIINKFGITTDKFVSVQMEDIGMVKIVSLVKVLRSGIAILTDVYVHLEVTGMDLFASLARMDRSGILRVIAVFVLRVAVGMEILVLPVQTVKSGLLRLIGANVLSEPTGTVKDA